MVENAQTEVNIPNPKISDEGQDHGDRQHSQAEPDLRSAAEMISLLSGQILTLETLALTLESTMAENICECRPVAPDTIRTLQRIDFLRQALKDVSSMLTLLGPNLRWQEGREVSYAALRKVVDMHGSLDGLHPTSPITETDDGDIWF